MHSVYLIALALLMGCPSGIDDSDADSGGATDSFDDDSLGTDEVDTDVDTASGVVDLDRDGVPEDEDCDDREPLAFPGGQEVWDGVDNDCDGRIDGRGSFAGTMALQATAIVEGQTQRRSVSCDVSFTRQTVVIGFAVDCAVPSTDPLAVQLLGTTLIIEPVDNVAVEGSWSGQTDVSSDAGWQASGTGSAVWSQGLDQVALTVQLDSASLRLSGVSELTVSSGRRR